MGDGNWQAVLYLDQRVDEDQWVALEQIFSGRVGGQPALLMGFVSKIFGSYLARIDFRAEGKRRRLVVDGVAEAEIEGIDEIRGTHHRQSAFVRGIQPPCRGGQVTALFLPRSRFPMGVY